MWLEEYLRMIGCTRASSVEELITGQLARFHYCSVNLWAEGAKPLPVDRVAPRCDSSEAILADLKRDGFGFCFQLIEIHASALRELGHAGITRHPAVPLNCLHDDVDEAAVARSIAHETFPHEVMRLPDGGLVDVGYSANALQGVLRCAPGKEARCGDSNYRLLAVGPEWWQLEVSLRAGWTALYRFREQPATAVQFMVDNMFRTPQPVRIRDGFVYVARVKPGLREWLHVVIADRKAVWRRVAEGVTVEERAVESFCEAAELTLREFGWAMDERMRPLFLH